MKKQFLLLLFLVLFMCGCVITPPEKEEKPDDSIVDSSEKTIGYIPLDDRPVNTTRAKHLASSTGFTLYMPDEDLYRTRLDGQPKNSNNTQYGNMGKLLEWITNSDYTYYVISLDQLLSGGLVNSRVMHETGLAKTYAIIDKMLEALEDKQVVLFDTVMRLASTVGYNNYTSAEYNALRSYGALPRRILSGDFTVDDIVTNYTKNTSGNNITNSLNAAVLEEYLNARTRKIRLADYTLSQLETLDNFYLYYGVDDSSPKVTIQTNEISYIRSKLTNGSIFAGTDELGLMGITKVIQKHYDQELTVQVQYFGGMENSAADAYDTGTLKTNIDAHLNSLGVRQGGVYNIEILVLTKPSSSTLNQQYIDELIERLNINYQGQIPTIVIDASSSNNYGPLERSLVNNASLLKMIGYSNWNTVGNAIGIALSNGISRYMYLKYETNKTDEANIGFIKTATFAFVKDMTYKIGGQSNVISYIRNNIGNTSNFYSESLNSTTLGNSVYLIMNANNYTPSLSTVLKNLSGSEYITDLSTYQVQTSGEIKVSDFNFPWYRTFEIDFKIEVN